MSDHDIVPGPPADLTSNLTPMLRQYYSVKQETPDALLLFRLGDFYEMFFEDAVTASRELEITLTARQKESENPVPMCGVPYHAADAYIARLLRKGYKVAICDQMEAPQKGVKLVRREITRIVTPGTITDTNILSPGQNNFLMAVCEREDCVGCALLDVSTGEFRAAEFPGPERWKRLALEIEHFAPRELIYPERLKEQVKDLEVISKTSMDDWIFDPERASRLVCDQLGVRSLEGFGLADKPTAASACGAVVDYARRTQRAGLEHVGTILVPGTANYLVLDAATVRNLELVDSPADGVRATLLGVLDRTLTNMGARLVRNWLLRPSLETSEIQARLDAVGELTGSPVRLSETRDGMDGIFDLERLLSRIALATAGPNELVSLRSSLARLPGVAKALDTLEAGRFRELRARLETLEDLHGLLAAAIAESPSPALADGGVIRKGHHAELDELRTLAKDSKTVLASIEARERDRTGITSLKVRFNRVFGYYIEISKANLHLAPDDYDRKQTLVGAERFTTPELKEYEEKILTAEERALEIERRLFEEVRVRVSQESRRLRTSAAVVAELDALASLATVAVRFGYRRPEICDDGEFVVRKGRHPVIEALAEERKAGRFVPNDVYMNDTTDRIWIVTGPNMGGKSTFLRQNALLVIMAQMGSFVPADLFRLPLIDRIFTRIGASDNLARGQSTFMVEMTETALILNTATPKSLVILDEIGRGTATFDGLSLAWAIVEHLQSTIGAKTLFATHYHELTELADLLPGIRNCHVAARESSGRIVFLRTVEPGPADRSYGIEVARLAGIPINVTRRAREVLKKHEESEHQLSDNLTVRARPKTRVVVNQLSLFTAMEEEIRNSLAEIDVDNLTPLEALRTLAELKKKAHGNPA